MDPWSILGVIARLFVAVIIMITFFLPIMMMVGIAIGAAIANCLICGLEGDYSSRQKQLLAAISELGGEEALDDGKTELPPDFHERLRQLRREAHISGISREACDAALNRGRSAARKLREPGFTFPIGI
jgi:hypothetical protein